MPRESAWMLDESTKADALHAPAHDHMGGFTLCDCHCAYLPRNRERDRYGSSARGALLLVDTRLGEIVDLLLIIARREFLRWIVIVDRMIGRAAIVAPARCRP